MRLTTGEFARTSNKSPMTGCRNGIRLFQHNNRLECSRQYHRMALDPAFHIVKSLIHNNNKVLQKFTDNQQISIF